MPGRIKVGFTSRHIQERMLELSSATGVPEPFVLEACFYSDNPEADEVRIHSTLGDTRLPNREFFRVSIPRIIEVCTSVCKRTPFYLRPQPAPLPPPPEPAPVPPPLPVYVPYPVPVPYGDRCRQCGSRLKQHGGRTGWCKRCLQYWPGTDEELGGKPLISSHNVSAKPGA